MSTTLAHVARGLVSVSEARERVLARAPLSMPAERVGLHEALGRVLAADVTAAEDVPGFDNSAMDGFAVRAADSRGSHPGCPARLRIVGESRAGKPAARGLREGEAIRVSTGAMIPDGADAVVRLEEAHERDGTVEFGLVLAAGRDIRRAGEDITAGRTVLRAGALLGPAELGVLASVGVAEAAVRARPRLALVYTGDELVAAGAGMKPGGVRNSNAFTLSSLTRNAGASVEATSQVRDDPAATRAAIESALETDVVVVCGGVSVGAHDHVREALADLDAQEVFWGVALRPGRPTWFGVHLGGPASGGALVFGLPGNPVSAYVTFVLFVRPALRSLCGAPAALDRTTALLAEDVGRLPTRAQAVRCELELEEQGWLARPTGPQGSHVLTSLLGADALATIEAGEAPARAGERVPIELLPG